MDERRKTLAAFTVLIGFFVFILVIIGVILSSRSVVSPVPDERVIRVIFTTPTPEWIPPFDATSSSKRKESM